MTAAILQGVPGTTLDVDLWIDLPSRQYIRVLNLCRGLDAEVIANTVVVLSDETMVNFVYEVTGLRSFGKELRHAKKLRWLGRSVAVLPLIRIYKSKKAVGRTKDLALLPLIEQTLALAKKTRPRA